MSSLLFHFKSESVTITLEKPIATWLVEILPIIQINSILLKDLKQNFESHFDDFELFWFSKPIQYPAGC